MELDGDKHIDLFEYFTSRVAGVAKSDLYDVYDLHTDDA
jgi:hypothetical protein